jgi:putative transposase
MKGFFIVLGINYHFQDAKILPPIDQRSGLYLISMDGCGRWLDNVFIERLWRSLKYECVYLNAYETGGEARAGIGEWIDFYNNIRPHSGLDGITPNMCHEQDLLKAA